MLIESKGNCLICGEVIVKERSSKKYCANCNYKRVLERNKKLYRKFQVQRKKYAKSHYRDRIDYYRDHDKKYSHTPQKRFAIYKGSAKNKKIEFNLSFNDFMEYWQLSCFYCGCEIITIGIDRINNSKPYQKNNIVPCCSLCNSMKSNKKQIEFINQCIVISERFSK